MRTITTSRNGKIKEISSPWLRIEDAADYCGISRQEFTRRAEKLPHAGKTHRLYNAKILDNWINGDLDIPFDVDDEDCQRRPIIRVRSIPPVNGLTNPVTGRFVAFPAQ